MKEHAPESSRDGRKGEGRRTLASLMTGEDAAEKSTDLPAGMREELEAATGADMSEVSVTANDATVDDKGALAVTEGTNIAFGVGQFQPGTERGQELIRHEGAHVAQNLNTNGKAGSQADRESEANAVATGSATGVVQAGSAGPQFDIKSDLRDAMEGWGTDEDAIYSRLRRANADELNSVVSDSSLMSELRSELSDSEMKRVLNLLDAPLPTKLRLAMRGWGTDEDYIYSSLRNADAAELRQVVNNTRLMNQLRGELNDAEMRRVLQLLDAPPKVKIRMAIQGWGTDEDLIFQTLASATQAQLRDILNDTSLMNAVRDDLSREHMNRVLNMLNAPLADKLRFAMRGWGTDEDYIYNSIAAASDAERAAVGNDQALMEQLRGELSRGEYLRAITDLGVAIPLERRLNMAMDGWGVEADYIFQQLSLASDAEKQQVLENEQLVARLRSELSGKQYQALLDALNADIETRLLAACDGWGTDERYIYDTIFNASDADKQAILANDSLMERLKSELTRGETNRLLDNLNAPLETKLEFAMQGWGTDEDYIRRTLATATEAEKEAIKNNQALLDRLKDELSEEEFRAAFGTTPEIEAFRLYEQGDNIAAIALLTADPAQCKAKLDAFDALSSSLALIRSLPSGADCPNDVREDLGIIIDNDTVLSRVQAAFEIRWNVDLKTRSEKIDTDGDGEKDTDDPADWTVDEIRRTHMHLKTLPDSHVLSGLIDDIIQTGGNKSGAWWNGSDIGIGEGAYRGGSANPSMTTYGAATGPGRRVSWLGAAVRHEVGHAVDDMLGDRANQLKVGLGGWWWSNSVDEWAAQMPNAFSTASGTLITPEEQEEIKEAIDDYLDTDAKARLDKDLENDHPIKRFWNDSVPIIETAKHTQGQGKSWWTQSATVDSRCRRGGKFYTLQPYYGQYQIFNASVFDQRVRDYSYYSHAEFFAELYTVYYEDGNTPDVNPGQHIPNAAWREWFDRNVHGAGRDPESVAGNGVPNASTGVNAGTTGN